MVEKRNADARSTMASNIRGILLIPVAALSLFLLMLGIVGSGFGATLFMLPYLALMPVFLLNFISPKASVVGMWSLLVVQYVEMAVFNWPHINPLRLWSKGSILLVIAAFLNQIAAVTTRPNAMPTDRADEERYVS